jgi:pyruvate,water dikinase
MVDSNKSGVIFSKNPAENSDNIVIEAVWGLGESIVSGKVTPDKYVVSREMEIIDSKINIKKLAITRSASGEKVEVKLNEDRAKMQVLKNHEIKKLAEIALKLEEHYQKPQDIEFAIEGEEIFITQTRPITTLENRFSEAKEIKGEIILKGLAASPGIASGKIKIIHDLKDLSKIVKGDILVTGMTNPDMVVSMQKAAAIVTDEGGLTAHAAIVSREMGIPAVVGTQNATTKLKEGEIITVNGFTGNIFKGKVAENVQKEIKPVTEKTKTEIKVLIDLPSFAERAAKTNLKAVGLARLEGTISESGKHPNFFLQNKKFDEYEEIIFKGVKTISDYFEEIWVRTSDIRSDEFANLEGAPKEKEANPMLGMHGIRYSLRNPEIFKAELRALQRVSKQGKKMGVLLPQIISLEEIQQTKKILKEMDFKEAKLGVMVETPASVQLIREFCEEGIDFISFGTNDLTQYILAVDRGNEEVQEIFNEMHPAVLHQLEYVLRVCKRAEVETSICGQAGSKKEMVKFLVERGIDSISVNADVASDIAAYVLELENGESVSSPEVEKEIEEEKPLSPNITEKADVEEKPREEVQQTKIKEEVEEKKEEPVSNENNGNSQDGAEVEEKSVNNNLSDGSEGRDTSSDESVREEPQEEKTLIEEDPAKKPIEEKETTENKTNNNGQKNGAEVGEVENEKTTSEETEESPKEESSGGINLENEHPPNQSGLPNIPGSEFALQKNLEAEEEVLDIF